MGMEDMNDVLVHLNDWKIIEGIHDLTSNKGKTK